VKGRSEMALFAKAKPVNYEEIVAPLRDIESNLSEYIGAKNNEISEIEGQKKKLDEQKAAAEDERGKSETTLTKIAELLS
jgi:hypothetical protein